MWSVEKQNILRIPLVGLPLGHGSLGFGDVDILEEHRSRPSSEDGIKHG